MVSTPQEKSVSGQKTPQEIVTTNVESMGLDPHKFMAQLAQLKKDKKAQTVQIGNTVFLVIPSEGGVAEVHTFSVENPKEWMQRFKSLALYLKKQGFKKGVSYSDNPAFKRIVESSGMPIKISQSTKMIGGVMKPVYVYEMEV
jgi:hypothetical protein